MASLQPFNYLCLVFQRSSFYLAIYKFVKLPQSPEGKLQRPLQGHFKRHQSQAANHTECFPNTAMILTINDHSWLAN